MNHDTSLADGVLKGNVRSAARLIRLIDDGDKSVLQDLATLYRHAGRAHIVGFTGSPGVGKSTLVDRIVSQYREHGKSVGILAVDPTSPFTGGAILGDRIRMQKHFLDEAVFIRSMATRGQFGGLTRSTADAMVVLDAMGKDVIIIETVGVGQDEIDIAHMAHTTVLVTVPGMGDDIQAIKAGLMEIGDIFVVNKADREGAGKTVRELRFMIQLTSDRYENTGWIPPILETTATLDTGIHRLYEQIQQHYHYLTKTAVSEWKNRERVRIRKQVIELLKESVIDQIMKRLGGVSSFDTLITAIVERQSDPYNTSEELLKAIMEETQS
jgi:LAO/AO transport system kinase